MARRNPGLGVDWHVLREHRDGAIMVGERRFTVGAKFASTTRSSLTLLEALADDNPAITVDQARAAVLYDPELAVVLDRYVADGHGGLPVRGALVLV